MKSYLPSLATIFAIAFAATAAPAAAQSADSHGGHGHGEASMHSTEHGHGHGSHSALPIKGTVNEVSKAYAEANAKMHAGMEIEFTGDADVDFVRGMIPHHQGAVDMARIVLQYGKDPEIRKLAGEIIKAQEAEISMMQEWLKKRGLQ